MIPPLLLRAPSPLKAAARITMGRRDLEHHDEATRPMTGVDFGDNRDLASEEGDLGTGRPNRNQTTEADMSHVMGENNDRPRMMAAL